MCLLFHIWLLFLLCLLINDCNIFLFSPSKKWKTSKYVLLDTYRLFHRYTMEGSLPILETTLVLVRMMSRHLAKQHKKFLKCAACWNGIYLSHHKNLKNLFERANLWNYQWDLKNSFQIPLIAQFLRKFIRYLTSFYDLQYPSAILQYVNTSNIYILIWIAEQKEKSKEERLYSLFSLATRRELIF